MSARLVHAFLAGELTADADGVVVPRPRAGDPLAPRGRLRAGAHAALDHLTAPSLLVLPRVLGWSPRTRRLLAAFGAFGVADALLTDYPGGVLRRIPMPVHLNLEASGGLQLLLAAVTVLRGEPATQRWAVAAQGLAELVRATGRTRPQGRPGWSRRRPRDTEGPLFCYERVSRGCGEGTVDRSGPVEHAADVPEVRSARSARSAPAVAGPEGRRPHLCEGWRP